jgi:hypothetical protein
MFLKHGAKNFNEIKMVAPSGDAHEWQDLGFTVSGFAA